MLNKISKFGYRDGSEEALIEIVGDENFSENETWRKHKKNWPIFYHLTPLRQNLIDWIPFKDSTTVLELGAGCGPITAALAINSNIKKIVAVEGSPARAEIIRQRCKKSEKVSVIIKNINELALEDKFDIVTLIGVLEYAGKYGQGDDPFKFLIEKARSFLRPNGILLIAIENQLGHKYLAGLNEDHYKRPYEGINGYPNYNGVKTFDKQSLKSLIDSSGLTNQQWFYPFPDYKTPDVILGERAFVEKDFNWLDLLGLPTKDYAWNKRPQFNEKQFLKTVAKNQDVSVLMNSFLVFASSEQIELKLDSLLGCFMRTEVAKEFRHSTKFEVNNEEIIVSKNDKQQKYLAGFNSLHNSIIDNILTSDIKSAKSNFEIWFKMLSQKEILSAQATDELKAFSKWSDEYLGKSIYRNEDTMLSSDSVDFIPKNIFVNEKTGDSSVIDLEWDFKIKIPRQLVIDRGIYYLLKKIRQFNNSPILSEDLKWNLPRPVLELMPETSQKPNLEELFTYEYWLQNLLMNGSSGVLTDEDKKLIKSRADGVSYSQKNKVKENAKMFMRKLLNKAKGLLR